MSTLPAKKKKKMSDAALWDSIAADAELQRIKGLTDEEVRAEIRADGGDPDAIGARGAELAARLLEQHGIGWKERAAARRAEIERKIGEWPSFAGLPRADLLARVVAARGDSRFTGPIAAAFRKRDASDVGDDELRALVEEIEALRRMHAK